MQDNLLAASVLAMGLTGLVMLALAPSASTQAPVLAGQVRERMLVARKGPAGPPAEIADPACRNGGCEDTRAFHV